MNFPLVAYLVKTGFPGGSAEKESACNAGDLGSAPGLGRFPGEGKGHPLQCSGLEKNIRVGSHHVCVYIYTQTYL